MDLTAALPRWLGGASQTQIASATAVGILGVALGTWQRRRAKAKEILRCEKVAATWSDSCCFTLELSLPKSTNLDLTRSQLNNVHVDAYGPSVPGLARMFLPMGCCQYLGIKTGRLSQDKVITLQVGEHSWRSKVQSKLEELAQQDDVIIVEVAISAGEAGDGLNPEPICIAPVLPSALLAELQAPNRSASALSTIIADGRDAIALCMRPRQRTLLEALLRWALCPTLAVLGAWLLYAQPEKVLARLPIMPGFGWTKAMVSIAKVLPPVPKNLLEAFDLGVLCERFARETTRPAQDAVLEAAATMLGRPVSGEELLAIRAELMRILTHKSIGQKVAGFFTFVNTMWLAAIGGITISVGPVIWLATGPIRQIMKLLAEKLKRLLMWLMEKIVVPAAVRLHNWGVWEGLAHFAALTLTAQGSRMPSDTGTFVAVSGLVAGVAAVQYSTIVHGKQLDKAMRKKLNVQLSTLQRLLDGLLIMPVAVLQQSTLLGYAATMSFLSALGFGGAMYPFCYCIGWDSSDDMVRTCVLCGLTLVSFGGARIQGVNSQFLSPFASPVSVLGGLGHYLALLILSNRWYHRRSRKTYVSHNAGMLVSLLGFQFVGRIYGLEGLANTSTTFFVLWLLEKSAEIQDGLQINPWFFIFGGSIFTYYAALWLHAHPAFVVSLFRGLGN